MGNYKHYLVNLRKYTGKTQSFIMKCCFLFWARGDGYRNEASLPHTLNQNKANIFERRRHSRLETKDLFVNSR